MASTNKIKKNSVTQLNSKKEQNVRSVQKAVEELRSGTGTGVARTETGRKLDALNDSTEVRAAWNAAYEQAQAAAEKEYRDIAVREAYAQRKNKELRRTLNMLGYKFPEDMTTVGQAVAGNAANAQRNILGFNTKEDILAARLGGAQGQGATAAAMAADNPLIRAAAEASARNATKMGQTAHDIETLMRERYNSTREAVPYAYQTENGQFVYNENERKELAERKRLQDRAPRQYFQTVEKLHGNTKQTLTDKEKTMAQEDVEGFRKMLHDHGVITELNQYIDPTNSYGDETLRTYISKINNLMTDQEKNAAWYILKNDGAETYRAYIDSKWDELMARERQQEDKDIQEWAKEHPGRSSLEALAQMFEGAGAAALTYGTRFIQGFREGVYGEHPEQDPWEQRAGIKSNVTIDRNDIANRAVEQAGIRLGSDAGRFGTWVGNKAENAVNSLGEKTGVEAEDVYKVIDAVKGAKDWAAGKIGLRKEDGGETEQKSAYAKPVDWTQLRRSGHGLGKDLGVAQAASEAGKGLFNTAFELVRSAMAQRLFGDAGTVVSGLTSMVSTFNEAYDRGATSDQALALGSIDGMLEIYTESATFENLRDAYTGRVEDMPGRIVRAALSEGSEEFASAALGMLADMSILGSKSEFDTAVRELMAKGMSEKEAAAKVYHDQAMSVVKDTVMGMLSGTMGQVMATPAAPKIPPVHAPRAAAPKKRPRIKLALYADYTFENFIEGDCNSTACEACKSVAEKPGDPALNPLFVYGKSGLGKTHLLQSIAGQMLKSNSQIRVVYCHAYEFLRDATAMSKALDAKLGNVRELAYAFQEKYENCDVLLLDDVQLLEYGVSTHSSIPFAKAKRAPRAIPKFRVFRKSFWLRWNLAWRWAWMYRILRPA